MPSTISQEREQLHALVDHLAPDQVHAVRDLVEAMLSPIERSLALAPLDDEPVTAADRAAMDEAIASIERDGTATTDDVLAADFGLTRDEFDRLNLQPLPAEPRRNG